MSFNLAMDGAVTYPIVGLCFTVGTVVALIVVWFFSKFQTKHAASASHKILQSHIDRVDEEVRDLQTNLAKIGSDVSYIRGRLEPKGDL